MMCLAQIYFDAIGATVMKLPQPPRNTHTNHEKPTSNEGTLLSLLKIIMISL